MNPIPVLLLAGSRPGRDPICATYGTDYKSVAPVAGVPMVLHALRNLTACNFVSEIIVLAQEPEKLQTALEDYPLSSKVRFCRSSSTISATVLETWDQLGGITPLLITTADNCLLGKQHLDEFLSKALAHESDIAMGFVTRNKLQASYPESGRTWIRFSDTELTGCNLFLLKSKRARLTVEFWEDFEARPKKILRMAWNLGPAL
ncbi:MAG: NTP transferase domain-containing protein, partial [Pseudohongiellaceae bacterium]